KRPAGERGVSGEKSKRLHARRSVLYASPGGPLQVEFPHLSRALARRPPATPSRLPAAASPPPPEPASLCGQRAPVPPRARPRPLAFGGSLRFHLALAPVSPGPPPGPPTARPGRPLRAVPDGGEFALPPEAARSRTRRCAPHPRSARTRTR